MGAGECGGALAPNPASKRHRILCPPRRKHWLLLCTGQATACAAVACPPTRALWCTALQGAVVVNYPWDGTASDRVGGLGGHRRVGLRAAACMGWSACCLLEFCRVLPPGVLQNVYNATQDDATFRHLATVYAQRNPQMHNNPVGGWVGCWGERCIG